MEKVYKNSSVLFIAVLIMAFFGFYRTYFGLFPAFENVGAVFHFHTAMILIWFAILITQPILIKKKKIELHRQIGKMAYFVVVLLVVSVILLMRIAWIRDTPVPPGGIDIKMVGMGDLTFFLLMYLLAMYYRHKSNYHARYMVLSILSFMNPALGRLGFPGPLLAIAIMVALLIYEFFNEKVYRPYVVALPAYIAIYVFFIMVINAAKWKAFWWMFF